MTPQHQELFYKDFYDEYVDCVDDFFSDLKPGERFTTEQMVEMLAKRHSPFSNNFLYNWVTEEVIKTLYEQKRIKYVFRGSYVKVK